MKPIQCLVVDDEPTAREILEMYIEQINGLELAGSCKNALEAFNAVANQSVDLVFLDIRMPDITGISLAKALNDQVKVIFTTAYRDYAVEGFDLQAVDYLLKPISLERFLQAVQKYKKENPQEMPKEAGSQERFLLIKSDRKTVKVAQREILYIESLGDYLKIHTDQEVIVTRETISGIESRLPIEQFVRVHRSFIVALAAVKSFNRDELEINGSTVPISRSYRTAAMERLKA